VHVSGESIGARNGLGNAIHSRSTVINGIAALVTDQLSKGAFKRIVHFWPSIFFLTCRNVQQDRDKLIFGE
jgi:hypothetical protein